MVEQEIVGTGLCHSQDAPDLPVHIVREHTREPYDYVTFYIVFGQVAAQPPYPVKLPGFLSSSDAVHHAQQHVAAPITWC
jgi:hypothetical protein